MIAKVLLVIAFVAVAVAVGIYCRRHTGTVDGFILGGRNVGPWMSAFAYGTSYFSAVVFVGYALCRVGRALVDRSAEDAVSASNDPTPAISDEPEMVS